MIFQLATVAVLFFAVAATAVTSMTELATEQQLNFYISAVSGNNSKSGSSPTEAWQTLAFATQRISIVLNGTNGNGGTQQGSTGQRAVFSSISIYLECNSTFLNDPFELDVSIRRTGASIMVTQYNCDCVGDHPVPLRAAPAPLLQHTRAMTSEAPCLAITNVGGGGGGEELDAGSLVVEGLHFSGCPTGLHIDAGHDKQLTNLVVHSNTFTDIHMSFLRYAPANPKWASSIALSGKFQNFTIRHNIAARIDTFIQSKARILNFLVDSNTVQECGGNCISMGLAHDSTVQNNVFNRDNSERLFMYGTTDIIIGGMTGRNVVRQNDFNQRGEYMGGPDGCAFDFETAATGFEVSDNIFYKSYGSGIMIFGHASTGTSQNLTIKRNVFFECGCQQTRADSSAIAVMCGGGHRPSGMVVDSVIFKCQGPNANPPIHISAQPPHCEKDLHFVNTQIDPPSSPQVERPQVEFNPPSPSCDHPEGTYNVKGMTRTSNATVRYTLDGSRPTEVSPIMPVTGLTMTWPSAVVNINLKAFRDGYLPSVTDGSVIELNYNLCREAPKFLISGPAGMLFPVGIYGKLEAVTISSSGSNHTTNTVWVSGWVVDPLLPSAGWGPVPVAIYVDAELVTATVAAYDRPDIVKAHFAPNPHHGFHMVLLLDAAARTLLGPGTHIVSAMAMGTPGATAPTRLSMRSEIQCTDGVCQP